MNITLDDEQLKNLEATCANRWPAVRRILGIEVNRTPPTPDPTPVDRAGRPMFDDAGDPIPVEERSHADDE